MPTTPPPEIDINPKGFADTFDLGENNTGNPVKRPEDVADDVRVATYALPGLSAPAYSRALEMGDVKAASDMVKIASNADFEDTKINVLNENLTSTDPVTLAQLTAMSDESGQVDTFDPNTTIADAFAERVTHNFLARDNMVDTIIGSAGGDDLSSAEIEDNLQVVDGYQNFVARNTAIHGAIKELEDEYKNIGWFDTTKNVINAITPGQTTLTRKFTSRQLGKKGHEKAGFFWLEANFIENLHTMIVQAPTHQEASSLIKDLYTSVMEASGGNEYEAMRLVREVGEYTTSRRPYLVGMQAFDAVTYIPFTKLAKSGAEGLGKAAEAGVRRITLRNTLESASNVASKRGSPFKKGAPVSPTDTAAVKGDAASVLGQSDGVFRTEADRVALAEGDNLPAAINPEHISNGTTPDPTARARGIMDDIRSNVDEVLGELNAFKAHADLPEDALAGKELADHSSGKTVQAIEDELGAAFQGKVFPVKVSEEEVRPGLFQIIYNGAHGKPYTNLASAQAMARRLATDKAEIIPIYVKGETHYQIKITHDGLNKHSAAAKRLGLGGQVVKDAAKRDALEVSIRAEKEALGEWNFAGHMFSPKIKAMKAELNALENASPVSAGSAWGRYGARDFLLPKATMSEAKRVDSLIASIHEDYDRLFEETLGMNWHKSLEDLMNVMDNFNKRRIPRPTTKRTKAGHESYDLGYTPATPAEFRTAFAEIKHRPPTAKEEDAYNFFKDIHEMDLMVNRATKAADSAMDGNRLYTIPVTAGRQIRGKLATSNIEVEGKVVQHWNSASKTGLEQLEKDLTKMAEDGATKGQLNLRRASGPATSADANMSIVMPGSGTKQVVSMTVKMFKDMMKDALKGEKMGRWLAEGVTPEVIEAIEKGEMHLISTSRVGQNVLEHTPGYQGGTVPEYVLTHMKGVVNTEVKLEHQVARSGGFHLKANGKGRRWIRQPKKKGDRYVGDNTVMSAPNERVAEAATKAINDIRHMAEEIKAKSTALHTPMSTREERKLLNYAYTLLHDTRVGDESLAIMLGEDMKRFIAHLTKNMADGKGIDTTMDFVHTADKQISVGAVRDGEERWGINIGNDALSAKGAHSHENSQLFIGAAEAKNGHVAHLMDGAGGEIESAVTGIYQGGLDALKNGVKGRMLARARERFLFEFRDAIDFGGHSFNEILADSEKFLHQIKWAEGVGPEFLDRAIVQHNAINRLASVRSIPEQMQIARVVAFADKVGRASPTVGKVVKRLLAGKDGKQHIYDRIKRYTYLDMMSGFNPATTVQQVMGIVATAGINGAKTTARGSMAAMRIRTHLMGKGLTYSKDLKALDYGEIVKLLPPGSGWNARSLEEAWTGYIQSGFHIVNQHTMADTASKTVGEGANLPHGAEVVKKRVENVFLKFFKAGEQANRDVAFMSSYQWWRKQPGNADRVWTKKTAQEVDERTRLAMAQMDSASKSEWQEGGMGSLFQFLGWQVRFHMLMVSPHSPLTAVERTRTWFYNATVLTGVPGSLAVPFLPMNDIWDYVWEGSDAGLSSEDVSAEKNLGKYWFVHGGVASLLSMLTGRDYDADQLGTGSGHALFTAVFNGIVGEEKVSVQNILGAGSKMATDAVSGVVAFEHILEGLVPITMRHATRMDGDLDVEVVDDFAAILGSMSTLDKTVKIGLYYSLGKVRDKNGRTLFARFDGQDAILKALGITQAEVTKAYKGRSHVRRRKATLNTVKSTIRNLITTGIKANDPQVMNRVMVKAEMLGRSVGMTSSQFLEMWYSTKSDAMGADTAYKTEQQLRQIDEDARVSEAQVNQAENGGQQ